MDERLTKIIDAACQAPSGDNSQPWRFSLKENVLEIYNTPDKDIVYYNYNQYGSLVAIGAAIENVVIAARNFGFMPEVDYFPLGEDNNLIATISLKKAETSGDPLYKQIFFRVSNRHFYKKQSVDPKIQHQLSKETEKFDLELRFITENNASKKIARAFSANEKIVLETKEIHNIFFHHVLWSKKQELQKKTGLYVRALELTPPQRIVFTLYRYWTLARLFNFLGLSKFIAAENSKLYSSSNTLAAILANNESKENFVKSGRAMQRVWLIATELGLALHPVTGTIFLMHSLRHNTLDVVSYPNKKLLSSAYDTIEEGFGAIGKSITMTFRLGMAPSPSDKSSRLEPKIEEK